MIGEIIIATLGAILCILVWQRMRLDRFRSKQGGGQQWTTRKLCLRMPGVGFIGMLIIGILAGCIAEKVTASDHGLLTNLLVGIAGSFVGGTLANVLNIQFYGWLGNLIVASIGAILDLVDLAGRQGPVDLTIRCGSTSFVVTVLERSDRGVRGRAIRKRRGCPTRRSCQSRTGFVCGRQARMNSTRRARCSARIA